MAADAVPFDTPESNESYMVGKVKVLKGTLYIT